jgi:hypothetical protein
MSEFITPRDFQRDDGHGSIADFGDYLTVWKRASLRVLRSLSTMKDGSRWIHVSASRATSHPTWEDLVKVKENFIGQHVDAVMVLPKREDHVNIHPHCFHWWSHWDGPFEGFPNLQDIVDEKAV